MLTSASSDRHMHAYLSPAFSHGPPARTLWVTMFTEQAGSIYSSSSQVSGLHRAALDLHHGFFSCFSAAQTSGDSVMSTGGYLTWELSLFIIYSTMEEEIDADVDGLKHFLECGEQMKF